MARDIPQKSKVQEGPFWTRFRAMPEKVKKAVSGNVRFARDIQKKRIQSNTFFKARGPFYLVFYDTKRMSAETCLTNEREARST